MMCFFVSRFRYLLSKFGDGGLVVRGVASLEAGLRFFFSSCVSFLFDDHHEQHTCKTSTYMGGKVCFVSCLSLLFSGTSTATYMAERAVTDMQLVCFGALVYNIVRSTKPLKHEHACKLCSCLVVVECRQQHKKKQKSDEVLRVSYYTCGRHEQNLFVLRYVTSYRYFC